MLRITSAATEQNVNSECGQMTKMRTLLSPVSCSFVASKWGEQQEVGKLHHLLH